MTEMLERLAAAEIELLPDAGLEHYLVFGRRGFVALVRRGEHPDGSLKLGPIGTSGLMTGQGLAMLYWRGDRPVFVTRAGDVDATPEQVAESRQFGKDLKAALGL